MATKDDLRVWIPEALTASGGGAHHIRVAEYIWAKYELDLRKSGDFFYTWQYDLRWVAKVLRDEGTLEPIVERQAGIWRMVR